MTLSQNASEVNADPFEIYAPNSSLDVAITISKLQALKCFGVVLIWLLAHPWRFCLVSRGEIHYSFHRLVNSIACAVMCVHAADCPCWLNKSDSARIRISPTTSTYIALRFFCGRLFLHQQTLKVKRWSAHRKPAGSRTRSVSAVPSFLLIDRARSVLFFSHFLAQFYRGILFLRQFLDYDWPYKIMPKFIRVVNIVSFRELGQVSQPFQSALYDVREMRRRTQFSSSIQIFIFIEVWLPCNWLLCGC